MKRNDLYLAADSGGSKTLWVLLDKAGNTVAEYKTHGLGAVKAGILPVLDTVKEAFRYLKSYGTPNGIFLSLGGPNVVEVQDALHTVWEGIPSFVEREASGNAILQAAAFLDCSAAILCGTGSTAMGHTVRGIQYAGGWGPTYGDGGSGGGLGQDALKLFLRSLDGMEEIGKVGELFAPLTAGLDVTGFFGRMEAKSRALGMSRRDLAALAPEIYKLAVDGDTVALGLYRTHAKEIALLANSVSDNSANYKVLICGGFLTNKPLLLDMCCEEFAKLSCARLYYVPAFSPIVAAKMAVLTRYGVSPTRELFDKILRT